MTFWCQQLQLRAMQGVTHRKVWRALAASPTACPPLVFAGCSRGGGGTLGCLTLLPATAAPGRRGREAGIPLGTVSSRIAAPGCGRNGAAGLHPAAPRGDGAARGPCSSNVGRGCPKGRARARRVHLEGRKREEGKKGVWYKLEII